MFTLNNITESAPALNTRERGHAVNLARLIAKGKGDCAMARQDRDYLAEVNPALLASVESR